MSRDETQEEREARLGREIGPMGRLLLEEAQTELDKKVDAMWESVMAAIEKQAEEHFRNRNLSKENP